MVALPPVPAITGTRPCGDLHGQFDHAFVLREIERGRFAGRADRHQAVDPARDLKFDLLAQAFLVEPLLLNGETIAVNAPLNIFKSVGWAWPTV